MARRRMPISLGVLGVVLVVAALLVRFVLLPSVNKLPSDLSSSQQFSGTFSGLNSAALASGDASKIAVQDVPITADRGVTVDQVDGNTAVITSSTTLTMGGTAQPASTARYAVDRTTYETAAAPSGVTDVVPSQGLVFTFPQHPDAGTTYQLFDPTTGAAYPATYAGTSEVKGRSVLQYQSTADGPIPQPAALGLPTSVTKTQIATLGPVLASLLPPAVAAQLPAALGSLPDTIPLSYTSKTVSALFVDSTLGSPVNVTTDQTITGTISIGGQDVAVPFSTVTLAYTDAAQQSVADTTSSNAQKLELVGTALPLVLGILGILLVVVALVLSRRGDRSEATPGAVRTPASV